MSNATEPRPVHLVGSVPLSSNEEVFRAAGSILGDRLRRIPDGETGVRHYWIGWQIEALGRQPQLEIVPPDPDAYAPLPSARLREGVDPSEIQFDRLGYADAARDSYSEFKRLRDEGVLPVGTRFQVSLPTPLAVVNSFLAPENKAAVEPAYERRMLEELDEILGSIPHDDLAIQWDVAVEIGILEGVMPSHLANPRADILERIERLSNRVPNDVEMGYHLCYGDAEHQHFKQPADASLLVDLANELSARVHRPINWIHMPVPRGRTDDAYFAPLKGLNLHPETELYLGLVHYTDGVEGTRQRIDAARRTVADFGIATECGMGRRDPATVPDLLRIHAEASSVG